MNATAETEPDVAFAHAAVPLLKEYTGKLKELADGTLEFWQKAGQLKSGVHYRRNRRRQRLGHGERSWAACPTSPDSTAAHARTYAHREATRLPGWHWFRRSGRVDLLVWR